MPWSLWAGYLFIGVRCIVNNCVFELCGWCLHIPRRELSLRELPCRDVLRRCCQFLHSVYRGQLSNRIWGLELFKLRSGFIRNRKICVRL